VSSPDRDLHARLERLEALISEMEQGPESPARSRAREIVRAVLDLHADGLTRVMTLVTEASGAALVESLARDPMIAGLLLLHGLHPQELETRVRSAVDALEPMLQAQGARVALMSVSDGAIRLNLERAIGRGGLSTGALRERVEQAIIGAAPDASSIEIDVPDSADVAAFIPIEEVRLRGAARPTHRS
jgi:Fe-S cluster biogenesis protein NfuA